MTMVHGPAVAGWSAGNATDPVFAVEACNMGRVYAEAGHASGDVRCHYESLEFTKGGGGETFRPVAIQTYQTATGVTINAVHSALRFSSYTDINGTTQYGNITGGAGFAQRNTLEVPNWTLGGMNAPIKSEIYAEGASSKVGSNTAFFNVAIGGNSTGVAAIEDTAYLFQLDGFTSGSGNMWYGGGLRINIGGTTRYIPIGTDQSAWTPVAGMMCPDNVAIKFGNTYSSPDVTLGWLTTGTEGLKLIATAAADTSMFIGSATDGTVGNQINITHYGRTTIVPHSAAIDNDVGLYVYSPNDATTSFFTSTNNYNRQYLLRVQGYRNAAYPMGDAVHGNDDAAIFCYYRSYAADTATCMQRSMNIGLNHRGTSCGTLQACSIGVNASTSTAVSGDVLVAVLNNENYAPSTGGVSGVLDLIHTHEGPNAAGGEFGLRIRNAKKNGSATGAYIALDDGTCTTEFSYGLDISEADPATADIRLQNSVCIVGLTVAVTDNVTTTTLPEGSLAVTDNATGKGTLFIADSGGKWQALAQA